MLAIENIRDLETFCSAAKEGSFSMKMNGGSSAVRSVPYLQNGSVSFMFEKKGVIAIDNEDGAISEDKIYEDAMLDGICGGNGQLCPISRTWCGQVGSPTTFVCADRWDRDG